MSNLLEKLSNIFSLGQASDPTVLSEKLTKSIHSNLKDDEQLVHCIRNHRAFHNAKNFNKKNMFFNSICILTDRRLLIIRNLDYFKLFREIDLAIIKNPRIEKSPDDLVITLNFETAEDIIEFSKHSLVFAEEFSKVFEQTLKSAKDRYPVSEDDIDQKKCGGCGKLVNRESIFCSQCGHKFS